MSEAHYILTYPAFGTWLPGPGGGRSVSVGSAELQLPEPDRAETGKRRASLKWPTVELDEWQRRIVRDDIERVASIRGFILHDAVVAPDHVHVLFSCPGDADVLRLVQFIKGASARALTVAAGDEPAQAGDAATLPHHKWWGRQYILQRMNDQAPFNSIRSRLAEACSYRPLRTGC